MKRKLFDFFELRAVAIILVLLLALPCLSACGKQDADMEELKSHMRIANNCLCLHEISFSIENGRWDHYLSTPDTYNDPDFADIEKEKHSYRGVEYTLEQPIRRSLDYIGSDTIYSFKGKNERGETIYCSYTDEKKAPLSYSVTDGVLYGNERKEFNDEDCISVAADFIEYFVNECSDDRIDISDYSAKKNEKSEKPKFEFTRYYRGIPIHTITATLNEKCQVTAFYMNLPILDEDLYELIPEITQEQYTELARYIVEDMYANDHRSFTITDFKIDGTLGENGFTFKYSHYSDSYIISYEPQFTITLPDGKSEESPMFLVSYVLDPKPESNN